MPDIMRISSLSRHKYIVFLDTLNIADGEPILPHSFSQVPLAYLLLCFSLAIVAICIMRLSALPLNALFVFNRGFRFIGIRLRNTPSPLLADDLLLDSPDYSMKFQQRRKLTDTDTDTNTAADTFTD